ncbi:MAG: hypothetical protein J0L87_00540 [Bacteroidetes bacterium]|nr:hypothetical protein [Bacteroidota bacterium]
MVFMISVGIAQPTLDTIRSEFRKKPHPFVTLNSRNSFVNNEIVNVFGIKAGLKYGNKLRLGIGYNQLYNPPKNLNENFEYINELGKPYIISKGLKFYYFSATVEYVFYQTKHWEIGMPLQLGVGESYYQFELNGVKTKTNRNVNLIYEPAISVEYKIFKWVGVGADFGYRFMFANTKKLNQQLNSPIVTFDLMIYYREIFKSLFPNTKLAKRI